MKPPVTPAGVPPWGAAEALAVIGCVLSGRINRGGGPGRLENRIARQIGARHVKAVNSCRTAIELALRGLEVGREDEVILPSYLCESALSPVLRLGARPIFVDCGTDLQMSVPAVERAITPRTRAVLAPHLHGCSIEIETLEALLDGTRIVLVDDAAQSFGATRSGRYLGTFGSCGVVSCAQSKPLSGSGGGLLISNDPRVAESWERTKLGTEPAWHALHRVLRLWIWRRYAHLTAPFKRPGTGRSTKSHRTQCRSMAHLDAAVALLQLDRLGDGEQRRRAWSVVAEVLRSRIDGEVVDASPHAVQRDVVMILDERGSTRDRALERLRRVGVEAQPGYSALHLSHGPANRELPVTESLWRRVLVVPVGDPVRTAEALEHA